MLLASAALHAEVYKWVDENGLVHYGDHIPAKYAEQSKEILNDQGIRVGIIEGRKTPEELAAEAMRCAARKRKPNVSVTNRTGFFSTPICQSRRSSCCAIAGCRML